MMMRILLALALLLMPEGAMAQEDTMTIIHATDMHYISPELTDRGVYFTRMVESADGKVMMYSEELMEAFVEQMAERRPDALILSGDVTFNGARQSHLDLAKKLERIEAAGVPVYVLPGNHDIGATSAAKFEGDGFTRVESVSAEAFAQIYAPFGYDEAIARDRYSLSYVAALAPDLRLLMVDVNGVDAPGTVMSETIAWARTQLRDAQAAGARVIAVSHQNLMVHNALFPNGFAMKNNERLLALYEEYGVRLNLSGHMHMQHKMVSPGGVTEVATSALSVLTCQYGVMEIGSGQLAYRTEPVDVSAWAARHGRTEEALLGFAAYARNFFTGTDKAQSDARAVGASGEIGLDEAMAMLNAAYFSGRLDEVGIDEMTISRLEATEGFWGLYVRSITQEGPVNHTLCKMAF